MVIDFEERKKMLKERKEVEAERENIENEITYYVNKLFEHQGKQSKLKKKKICFFRNYRIKLLEANIDEDKRGIAEFVRLHAKIS